MADDNMLSGSLQETIITALIYSNDSNARIISRLVNISWFEDPYREIVDRVVNHWRDYKEPPNTAHIEDVFDFALNDANHRRHNIYNRVFDRLVRLKDTLNTKYVYNRLFEFARRQNLKRAIFEAGTILSQSNSIEDYERVESILKDASHYDTNPYDLGFVLSDQSRALRFLDRNEEDRMPMAITELDQEGITPGRGELFLIIAPRGRGKCLSGNSLVQLPDGTRITIDKAVKDKIPTILASVAGKLIPANVIGWWSNGIKPIYHLTTSRGHQIEATADHKFMTNNGWKPLKDLSAKDYVAISYNLPNLGNNEIPYHKVRLLGYLIADGALAHTTSIGYTKEDPVIMQDFKNCVKLNGDATIYAADNAVWVIGITGPAKDKRCKTSRAKNNTLQWLRQLGLYGKKSNQKFVPEFIFGLTDKQIAEFLRTLLSSDGSLFIDKRGDYGFTYTASSKRLVQEVRSLLIRLGIPTNYRNRNATLNGNKIPGYAQISISKKADLQRFLEVVGWYRSDMTVIEKIRNIMSTQTKTWQKSDQKPYCEHYIFEQIQTIEPAGECETYDLTVDIHHNFTANEFLVHNSMFLHHIGRHAVGPLGRDKWNVLHITLENSEDNTAERYLHSQFNIASKDGLILTDFDREGNSPDGKVIGFRRYKSPSNYFGNNQDLQREFITRRMKEEPTTKLRIKEFPTGDLTYDGLEAYLDHLEGITGFIPDAILLDYPDLMAYDRRHDPRFGLGRLYQQLRGLAVKRNLAMIVATQSNREGENAKTVEGRHAAEDISKIATADYVVSYNQTRQEYELGLARLFVVKARNRRQWFSVLITQNYAASQFCLFSAPMNTINNYSDMLENPKVEEGSEENRYARASR